VTLLDGMKPDEPELAAQVSPRRKIIAGALGGATAVGLVAWLASRRRISRN
jgi:hypothetical protein